MNRQKKELIKKIEEMETWIAQDEELGCGFAPPGAYDEMYKEIYQLREKLAQLRHCKTVEDMYYDERGQPGFEKTLQQTKPVQSQKSKRSHKGSKGMER